MKRKFPQKTRKPAGASVPPNSPAVKIPAIFKKYEGKNPDDVIREIISKVTSNNEDATKALAGVFLGMGDIGLAAPEWVKRASQKMLEGTGLDFMAKMGSDIELVQFSREMGKAVGVAEKLLKNPKPISSKIGAMGKKFAAPFVKFSKSVASEAEPRESEAFFSGRNESEKLIEIMRQPPQRAKIYLLIALCWQQIQKFNSTGEFHKWLLSLKKPDGTNLIAPGTDSREIRKICQSIGLEFENRWRTPKIKNPGHDA